MEVGILGPLEVRVGGAPVDIRRGLPRTLLTALALRAGETVGADALVELLWGDDQPQNPANALQIQVSYLRKAIAASGADEQPIVTRPGGYSLVLDPLDVDARRFEAMVRQASAVTTEATADELRQAAALLDEALALWRGDALADVAGEPFAMGETTRLTELRWEAVEARLDIRLALGQHRQLVGELGQLVADNPLRERFHEQLVLALYRSGRQADALRAYDEARKVLVEELGLDPGQRLQRLERDVLAQDPSLDWMPPAGAEDRPPERSAAAPSRRRGAAVPSPLTRLVGREVERARIHELLERNRAVTLTGPAGTGKTRLAIEVAHAMAGSKAVVYVELGDVADPDLVASTVAAAIGVVATPEDDAVELVAQRFEDEPALLVLDTCEHVLASAGAVASRVLRHSPGSHVLATSRRPLGIAGEIAWPVPPLALAPPRATTADAVAAYPAVALFCERASAVRPDFQLTDDNARDVAAICLALDGLPLAIELAAARADVLTPASIRSRLENRFALLVDGSTDAAARQQTLRGAIDWSFELLDADERRLFAELSVFVGSFALDAVQAVAGGTVADPLRELAGLVRQSVVMVVGDDRYRLLDSLRAYALERFGDGADDDLRRRHAVHYTGLAETAAPHVRGPDQVIWLDRIRTDIPNFRAALSWSFEHGAHELAARLAGALGWFWTLEGMLDEAVQVFEEALTADVAEPGVHAWLRANFGLLVASLGDLRRAQELGERSVELARRSGDGVVLGNALNTLAVAQWALGDFDAAAAAHDEAIAVFDDVGDAWGRGLTMTLRARTAIDRGEPDAAARVRAALPAARAAGDRHVTALAIEQLARMELSVGDVESGSAHAAECLELHEAIGYTEGMVAALHLIGRAHLMEGDVDSARRTHLRALDLATGIGHAAAICEAVEDLAQLAAASDPAAALRLLAAAEQERRRRGLVRRASDAPRVQSLRRSARDAEAGDADRIEAEAAAAPFADVVAELLRDV